MRALEWYFANLEVRLGKEVLRYKKGTPQGGIISPLLWLVYMDDLLKQLEEKYGIQNVFAYADDLVVLVQVKHKRSLIRELEAWCKRN